MLAYIIGATFFIYSLLNTFGNLDAKRQLKLRKKEIKLQRRQNRANVKAYKQLKKTYRQRTKEAEFAQSMALKEARERRAILAEDRARTRREKEAQWFEHQKNLKKLGVRPKASNKKTKKKKSGLSEFLIFLKVLFRILTLPLRLLKRLS